VDAWSEDAEFRIEAANVRGALARMKRVGKEWLAAEGAEWETIVEAFAGFGIDADVDSDGGVFQIHYEGHVPFESFDALFAALAPFVRDGGYIIQCDSDGGHVRWTFDGGSCKKVDVDD
jgi:hypothetical protein